TIGWGHLLPDLRHPPITPDEGEKLLRQDLRNARDALLALSPSLVHTTPARMAALTDFAFNLGAGHYARSTLRRRVQASDWPAAATEIQRWHFGHAQDGTVLSLPGLVTRRATEAAWLTQG
ncbi:MAG: lysozyme, partial [Pseudomonadota bacterium]